MNPIIYDALIDSLKMAPLLLIIYFMVEWTELKIGGKINEQIKKSAKAGPALGAAFGSVPQCGFSVIASALYTRKFITIGTLLAVYLSTSDEAIPVILAQPEKVGVIFPLILAKVIIALVSGYIIDFVTHTKLDPIKTDSEQEDIDEEACCKHHIPGKMNVKEMLVHPLIHTVKVLFFIFIVTLGINYAIDIMGQEKLAAFFLKDTVFQPVLTAIIGLIPNCAASVAITEMFLKGSITYGAAISGLCSSAGLGLIVLFKENKDTKDTFKVLLLLVGISITSGILIQVIFK